ncbi:MAG: RecX family transcriptional regulator [Pseudomonadota bacterium]|nr:RecX family transcriptional regulator [Pseudomonadota bacterium]
MAVERARNRNSRRPLDEEGLEQLALRYVSRYATTRAKLAAYLERKVRDRGWCGGADPPVETVVARMTELGFVDDSAYAAARAASLGRRGYGERRVRAALRAAGIEEEDAASAEEDARTGAWDSALRLARRRAIGPFAAVEPDRASRERALGILLRAGHAPELARRLAYARRGEIPDADTV